MSESPQTLRAFESGLAAWVAGALGAGTQVRFAAPGDAPKGRGLCCSLLQVRPGTVVHSLRSAPRELRLRYLVSAWAADEAEARELLVAFAFAVTTHGDLACEDAGLEAAWWSAWQVAPRPSWVLSASLRQIAARQDQADAPLVTQPLRLGEHQLRLCEGVVLGPADAPLVDVQVEAAGLHPAVRTDRFGRFRFAIPAEAALGNLIISGKGCRFSTEAHAQDGRLVIRFPAPEEQSP